MFQVFNTLQRTFYESAHGIYEFAKEILFDEVGLPTELGDIYHSTRRESARVSV